MLKIPFTVIVDSGLLPFATFMTHMRKSDDMGMVGSGDGAWLLQCRSAHCRKKGPVVFAAGAGWDFFTILSTFSFCLSLRDDSI